MRRIEELRSVMSELSGENMQKQIKNKKNVLLSLKGSATVALVIESSCLVSVFKTVTFESRL